MESHRVWNPTEEHVSTKIHGSWFSFAPGAFKNMSENHCNFIQTNRKETGLVILPDEFNSISDRYVEGFDKTEEGQKIMSELKTLGIKNLIEFHIEIIKNNQVSLRNDLAPRSPGVDPAKLASLNASAGEIRSMELVAKYKGKTSDTPAKKVELVNELMEKIGPLTY